MNISDLVERRLWTTTWFRLAMVFMSVEYFALVLLLKVGPSTANSSVFLSTLRSLTLSPELAFATLGLIVLMIFTITFQYRPELEKESDNKRYFHAKMILYALEGMSTFLVVSGVISLTIALAQAPVGGGVTEQILVIGLAGLATVFASIRREIPSLELHDYAKNLDQERKGLLRETSWWRGVWGNWKPLKRSLPWFWVYVFASLLVFAAFAALPLLDSSLRDAFANELPTWIIFHILIICFIVYLPAIGVYSVFAVALRRAPFEHWIGPILLALFSLTSCISILISISSLLTVAPVPIWFGNMLQGQILTAGLFGILFLLSLLRVLFLKAPRASPEATTVLWLSRRKYNPLDRAILEMAYRGRSHRIKAAIGRIRTLVQKIAKSETSESIVREVGQGSSADNRAVSMSTDFFSRQQAHQQSADSAELESDEADQHFADSISWRWEK